MHTKWSWLFFSVMVIAALVLGFWFGTSKQTNQISRVQDSQAEKPAVLYWVAPMDPSYRRDTPGKSPMGMDLVPVYADKDEPVDGVRVGSNMQHNLGVRTAAVQREALRREAHAVGTIGFDETQIVHINLRTDGWITALPINATGEAVSQGQLMFELYAPELSNAQKEYLLAIDENDTRLIRGGEEKLRALGMAPDDIAELTRRGEILDNLRFEAPQDGVVLSLNVREGMYVQPNTTVMSLAGLDTVWMLAEVFESQASWVKAGSVAVVRFEAFPGEKFQAMVDYVYPVLDPVTRSVRVRLNLNNAARRLMPNMYGEATIQGGLDEEILTVPRSAVIRGARVDRVVVKQGEVFIPREVMLGLEAGDRVQVLQGLAEAETVVTSAQFLLDSEASLDGALQRLQTGSDSEGGGEMSHDMSGHDMGQVND